MQWTMHFSSVAVVVLSVLEQQQHIVNHHHHHYQQAALGSVQGNVLVCDEVLGGMAEPAIALK